MSEADGVTGAGDAEMERVAERISAAPLAPGADPWQALRRFTPARIALGRAGTSLPVNEVLRFQYDHARAIDAVHAEMDWDALEAQLHSAGFTDTIGVASLAAGRAEYLRRPDLGRQLAEESRVRLRERARARMSGHNATEEDRAALAGGHAPLLIFTLTEGLSALALERHAVPLLRAVAKRLVDRSVCAIGPIVLARQGRVALQDEIGELLEADLVVSLIGERPGLGSPDSLGTYLTYRPLRGRTDADRNCVSNIRPAGLDYHEAAETLGYLIEESLRRKISGVALKDDRAWAC